MVTRHIGAAIQIDFTHMLFLRHTMILKHSLYSVVQSVTGTDAQCASHVELRIQFVRAFIMHCQPMGILVRRYVLHAPGW